jgi:hypothetical protein
MSDFQAFLSGVSGVLWYISKKSSKLPVNGRSSFLISKAASQLLVAL